MVAHVAGLAAILVATLAVSASAQREYPAEATIRGENIWLRTEPAQATEIVTYLQRGDEVLVTGDATAAADETFYPITVVDTGETGWVRALAIDPRTFAVQVQPQAVERSAPAPGETNLQGGRPRRNQNRAARSQTNSVAVDRPSRRDNGRQTNPRPVAAAPTGEIDCDDFATQEEAQDYFDSQGWSATNDPYRLDQGGIPGMPCEELP